MPLAHLVRPAAPGSHGSRLVLVHGFTQTARSWDPILPRFADHEIVLVDAPGHGDSAAVHADLATTGSLIAEVGGAGVYIGYSMGGRMVLHTALAHGELVEALVLVSATAGIDSDDERAARRAGDDALATSIETDGVEAFLERWVAGPLFAHLDRKRAGLEDRRRNTADGLAASLRLAGTGNQIPLWSELARLAMPVLCVAGALDPKFVAAGRRMVTAIGDRARLVIVEGAGHTVHLEQPARFSEALASWLDELA